MSAKSAQSSKYDDADEAYDAAKAKKGKGKVVKADPGLNDEENSEKSSQDGSPTEEGEKRGGVAGLFGNPFRRRPSLDKPPKNTSNDNNNPFQTSEAMAVLNAAMSEDFSAEEKKKSVSYTHLTLPTILLV